MAIEKPTYRLVESKSGIEIRDYDDYWVAECRMTSVADLNQASNRAFGRLFNYISGENSESQKIAMTSPVQQTPEEGGWLVSFVVPKDVSASVIPNPTNSSIEIKKVPAGRFAALEYSGTWSDAKFKAKSEQLSNALKKLNLVMDGPITSAVYNPPFMPPFLRRNEALVRVKNLDGPQNLDN